MAVRSLTLATNQGLIYVLSMVVVAGLVGGGALGYLVVAGFSQTSLFGKGLAAGPRSCCSARSSTARPRPHHDG